MLSGLLIGSKTLDTRKIVWYNLTMMNDDAMANNFFIPAGAEAFIEKNGELVPFEVASDLRVRCVYLGEVGEWNVFEMADGTTIYRKMVG